MARPLTRFTQRMLDSASCRQRYNLEFVKNFRHKEYDKFFPPKLKDLLSELLFARDYAIARGFERAEVSDLVNRMERKWLSEIRSNKGVKQEHIEDAREFVDIARKIVDHYSESQRIDLIAKYVKKKNQPIVRVVTEHRLPTFEKKKLGGPSKYTFASLIDRVFHDENGYSLMVRHFTSNANPDDVKWELDRRLDVYGTVWNAEKLLKKKISKIVFDVVRTRPPSMPLLINCKTCNGSGEKEAKDGKIKIQTICDNCAGTGVSRVSAKRCDTTVELWLREYSKYTRRKGILSLKTEKYKDQVTELIGHLAAKGNTFSYRIEVGVVREAIDTWLASTYEQIRELEAVVKRGTYPMNTGQCGRNNDQCPYRTACSIVKQKSDGVFFKLVDEEYPGLKPWQR